MRPYEDILKHAGEHGIVLKRVNIYGSAPQSMISVMARETWSHAMLRGGFSILERAAGRFSGSYPKDANTLASN